jgi:hypothetical protein
MDPTKRSLFVRQAEGTELEIRDFETRHPATIRMMLLVEVVCQVLMVAEIATIIVIFKLPFHAATVMALEAANRVVRTMGGWLPPGSAPMKPAWQPRS